STGPAEMLAMRALPVSPIGGWGTPAWFRSYYTFAPAAGGPDYRGEGLDIAPSVGAAAPLQPSFVFTGTVTAGGQTPFSYVCRADYNGNFIWEQLFPQFRNARSIRTNSLGRFVVAGQDTTATNAAIMEVLPSGLANWSRQYNNFDPQVQQSEEVIPTNDGGYISCGYTTTPPNLSDCHLIKMDANGRACFVTDLQTPQQADQVQRDIPWTMAPLPQPCVPQILVSQVGIEDTVLCIRKGCVPPPANLTLWLP